MSEAVELWTVQIATAKRMAQGRYRNLVLLPGRIPVVDTTVKSATVLGAVFAPTWELVNDWKKGRITWEAYTARYLALMRHRYSQGGMSSMAWVVAWDWVLLQDAVALACYCPAGELCHRLLLVDIFVKLGRTQGRAVHYAGEFGFRPQAEDAPAERVLQAKMF